MLLPSTKKGRRSEKNVSKAVRLTTDGSASTCPKSEFSGPSRGIDARGDVPDAVPRTVLVPVVAHGVVALHAVRVDREREATPFVIVGVDQELDLIRRAAYVPARERV